MLPRDAVSARRVDRHEGLVKRIADKLAHRLPRSIDREDLMQSGLLGLIEAVRLHKECEHVNFAQFASCRIRAAMIDLLRKSGAVPGTTLSQIRKIQRAKSHIARTGEEPNAAAIARALNMPLSVLHRTMRDMQCARPLSLHPRHAPAERRGCTHLTDGNPGPAEQLEHDDMRRRVGCAIDALTGTQRVILLLYYEEDLLLQEIGTRLHLSESRISQIVKQGVGQLRTALGAIAAAHPWQRH